MDVGWLLLRLALAAPVALMIWLIRRDIRRDGLEKAAAAAPKQDADVSGGHPPA